MFIHVVQIPISLFIPKFILNENSKQFCRIIRLHPSLISCHRNWCLLTTEKTESKPSTVIFSRASFRWNGFRHGAVAWILQTTSTSARQKQDIFVNQRLILLSTFFDGSTLYAQLSSYIFCCCILVWLAYLGAAGQTLGWSPRTWMNLWKPQDFYGVLRPPRLLPLFRFHYDLLTPTHWRNKMCSFDMFILAALFSFQFISSGMLLSHPIVLLLT